MGGVPITAVMETIGGQVLNQAQHPQEIPMIAAGKLVHGAVGHDAEYFAPGDGFEAGFRGVEMR